MVSSAGYSWFNYCICTVFFQSQVNPWFLQHVVVVLYKYQIPLKLIVHNRNPWMVMSTEAWDESKTKAKLLIHHFNIYINVRKTESFLRVFHDLIINQRVALVCQDIPQHREHVNGTFYHREHDNGSNL